MESTITPTLPPLVTNNISNSGRFTSGFGMPNLSDYTPMFNGNIYNTRQLWHVVTPQQAIATQKARIDDGITLWAESADYIYDAAGNLTFDGTYLYQYDAWNRLVQVNQASMIPVALLSTGPVNNHPANQILTTGSLVRSFIYDAFGRLVRTVSPWPEPDSTFAGYSTTHRYYYDGSRRIAEVRGDFIVNQQAAATASGGGSNSSAGAQAEEDEENSQESSSSTGLLEGAQVSSQILVNGQTLTVYTQTRLAKQYVWGPGDAGIDELIAQVDDANRAHFAIQDAGGDVIAWYDRGDTAFGSGKLLGTGPARPLATTPHAINDAL